MPSHQVGRPAPRCLVLGVLIACIAVPAFASGIWTSPWALPARDSNAERVRACAAYHAAMSIVDTLLRRPEHPLNARAASLARDAGSRAERVFGRDSEETIEMLFREAEGMARSSDQASPQALLLLRRVLNWRENTRGPAHLSLAPVLILQSRLYSLAQEPALVRTTALRAIAVCESQTPPDSVLLARLLVNTCTYLARVGDPRNALAFAQRAVEVRRHTHAPLGALASAINNVCATYIELGWAREAEPPCEEVYRLHRQIYEADDRRIGMVAGNLGVVRAQLGDDESALQLYEQSLRAQSRFFGYHYFGVGEILTNIAALHARRGRHGVAERKYREAIEVFNATVARSHTHALGALEGLGRALLAQGRLAPADSAFNEVLRRVPPSLEQSVPIAVPKALVGHAKVAIERGARVEARHDLELADSIFAVANGRDHVVRGQALNALAELEASAVRLDAALEALREACRLEFQQQVYTLRALPEEDILRYREAPAAAIEAAARVAASAPRDSAFIADIWDEVAAFRGLGRREMLRRLQLRIEPADSLGLVLEGRYREAARRADRLVSGLSSRARADALADVVKECEAAGREFARHLARDEQSFLPPRQGALAGRQALPRNAALVAFQRLEAPEARPGPAYVCAFVQPSNGGAPSFIRLGRADVIETALRRWRAAVEASRADDQSARLANRLGRQLATQVWLPIRVATGRAERVFVVADGELQTIAPWAWPSTSGSGAPDVPLISLLEHEADLVAPSRGATGPQSLLAVGDVDYGGPYPTRNLIVRSSSGDSISAGFEPLPASAEEIRSVIREWRESGGVVRVLTRTGATAAAFAEGTANAHVLHIATHTWALGARPDLRVDPGPLRRVGLAFAGANREDSSWVSVLTAAEIARLDLRDVRLVVVSSCRSALGRPLTGEGLLGLRSAFCSAGARTMITSLWSVSDESTAFWMQRFYAALRASGGDASLAARDATRATREWARSRGGPASPYAWGGFVVSGPP